jgi:hypothetical protein
MPDLSQSLQGRDLGHLRIVAELWGLELKAADARTAFEQLEEGLLQGKAVAELIKTLTPPARAALDDLMLNDGRLPWTLFTRRYGEIREMGSGRRDREKPYLQPISAAEILWYRALIGRSFFDSPTGPSQYVYIPGNLLALLPQPEAAHPGPLGRAASPAERARIVYASDRIIDHACTLLAALRLGLAWDAIQQYSLNYWDQGPHSPGYPLSPDLLLAMLRVASLLDEQDLPLPEPTRGFLEASRPEALAHLVRSWLRSPEFNELRLIPHLQAEGEWENDPLNTRQAVLDFIAGIPAGSWWSLPAFISAIRQEHPDFQRPYGDYDSWFIRDMRSPQAGDSGSGEFLRGFKHWDDVDGELVRFTIAGPMFWLGLVDLGLPSEGEGKPSVFRLSKWAARLVKGEAPEAPAKDIGGVLVSSDAKFYAPRLASRAARYQISRFCTWEGEDEQGYHYRVTPASLLRARQQGLSTSHLISLLRRHAQATPPSFFKALERWEQHGPQARLERLVVLRLSSPEIMQAVRASKAARFLGEPLGPTTIAVKPGAWEKVLAILAQMGYLGEANLEK